MLVLKNSYSTSLRVLDALLFLASSTGLASAASIPSSSSDMHMHVGPPPPGDSLSLIPASRHQQDDDKGTPIRLVVALHFEPPVHDQLHDAYLDSTAGRICMIIGDHAIAWDHAAVPDNYRLHLSELVEHQNLRYYSILGDIDLYTRMENSPDSILEEIESKARESQQKAEDSDLLTERFNHLDNFMNLLISGRYHVDVRGDTLENYKKLVSRYRLYVKPEEGNSQYLNVTFNVHRQNNYRVSTKVDMTVGTFQIPSSSNPRSTDLRLGSYDSLRYGRKYVGFVHFYGDSEETLRRVQKTVEEIPEESKPTTKLGIVKELMLELARTKGVTVCGVVFRQWDLATDIYAQALDSKRSNQRTYQRAKNARGGKGIGRKKGPDRLGS
ncbi:hypothetical protein F5878DRAFT_83179 [Lentinula raphanica]|uniref:Uncharacterized protein n=1 Tax=Lentinula raphanica TaxID=153919 RepID=A0AA38PCP1_9AGAR|nr:hypothetical protein F5878DRAFT_83179 [Lentinula raphanica]